MVAARSESYRIEPSRIEPAVWLQVNRELAAKTIGECSYEECLQPQAIGGGCYELRLTSGVVYTFSARETPWTWLRVDAASLARDGCAVVSAVQVLIDARAELGIDDITLGGLVEEIQNTLYSEVRRRQQLLGRAASELVALPPAKLQALLDGHPKILANKGRMGWGEDDLCRYAPESVAPFQLRFVALRRDSVTFAHGGDASAATLLIRCMNEAAYREIQLLMRRADIDFGSYVVIPVHPWQWQRFILPQYAEAIASGDLVDLGISGDRYLPQQSIRTLSNVDRPGEPDIKLALTILNTSCYRGVPGDPIAAGVAVSRWLRDIVTADPVLEARGLLVLVEHGGMHCPHPRQKQIAGSPYRYHEMLGAVWRDSIEAHLGVGELGILMSTLMQTDEFGRALLAEYVAGSGVGIEAWLQRLFECTVVPLYHLMCAYGVGLIAHGQNVVLVLRDGLPVRAAVKDFHGDIRLVDRDFPQSASLDAEARSALKRLPPEYLLHDLVTAHFVTTLRFISPLVEEQLGFSERRFYALLASVLEAYMESQPALRERFDLFPLFTEKLHKVCVNRVRFRIGYADNAERPLPELGTPIANPLLAGA